MMDYRRDGLRWMEGWIKMDGLGWMYGWMDRIEGWDGCMDG